MTSKSNNNMIVEKDLGIKNVTLCGQKKAVGGRAIIMGESNHGSESDFGRRNGHGDREDACYML